jgi:hypothetical protein
MVVTSWTDRRACHAGFVNTSINTYKRSLVRADLRTHALQSRNSQVYNKK